MPFVKDIPCPIFHVKCPLRGAIVFDNLGGGGALLAAHQDGALWLHSPGHVTKPPFLAVGRSLRAPVSDFDLAS